MGMRRCNEFTGNERTLRYVLHDLCVQWGYCTPPADHERNATREEITAEEFAIEVLKAEGSYLSMNARGSKKSLSFSLRGSARPVPFKVTRVPENRALPSNFRMHPSPRSRFGWFL